MKAGGEHDTTEDGREARPDAWVATSKSEPSLLMYCLMLRN